MIISKYQLPPSKLKLIRAKTEELIAEREKVPLGIRILSARARRREKDILIAYLFNLGTFIY